MYITQNVLQYFKPSSKLDITQFLPLLYSLEPVYPTIASEMVPGLPIPKFYY